MAEDRLINLLSPAKAQTEVFKWIRSKKGEIWDENSEIVDIIHFIREDVKELRQNRELMEALKTVDRGSFDAVKFLCDQYNSAIRKLWDEWANSGAEPSFLNQRASKPHVQFILLQCYNRAVAEPDKLNQYPPFSPQVYGETSFELISQMIETVTISPDDSFIDLGSGVGQVVLQVAACSDAKFCVGIEKAEYPSACAASLDKEFRRWMSFYGKSYRPYVLERGDFLSSEYHERIASAGVLFANNFAFGPEVDHQLKQRFANLKEGARIISSKAFCPLNFRISDRNLSDIGSIMHVTCLNPIQDAVSWTDKPFSYYVHTIDRSLLERYFSRLKNPKLRDENENVRRDRKGRIICEQALKDGFHPITTNGSGKLTKEVTENGNDTRNRRSHSLGSPTTAGQLGRSVSTINTSTIIQRSRSKGHLSDSGTRSVSSSRAQRRNHSVVAQRHRRRQTLTNSELTYVLRAKLNRPINSPIKSKLNKSRRLHRTVVDGRLASLSLNSDSRLLLSSASDSNVDSCPTGSSGHTTPSESTSLSSVGSAHGESHMGSGPDHEVEKTSECNHYATSGDTHSNHGSSNHGHPVGWNSAYSSSSSSSSFVSSSLTSTLNRSPPLTVGDKTSIGIGSAVLSSDTNSVQPIFTVSSKNSLRKNTDQPPIRITLSLSATKAVKSDTFPDESEADTTLTAEPELKNDPSDSSVARRRAVRKCRQVPQPSHPFLQSSNKFRGLRSKHPGRGRPTTLCRPNRSPKGRPPIVRPKKVVLSNRGRVSQVANLEMLHAETVAQMRLTRSEPNQPYGLNEPGMASFTCHYQPVQLDSLQKVKQHAFRTSSDTNIGHSQQAVPLALTQYLELTKRVFMDHLATIRSPAYVDLVRQQLAVEQARQAELLARKQTLEENIKRLHADGCDLLRNFTKRLGILISTPSAFFAQARKLIKHHHMLEDKIAEFRNEISQLSSANQELVRRHQVEAARLLSTALSNTKPTPHMSGKREQKPLDDELLPSVSPPKRTLKTQPVNGNAVVITSVAPVPLISNPPCLTHVAQICNDDPARTHSTKSFSGHRVRRSLPRLSPQSTVPFSSCVTGSSHSVPPSHAPILFRSPEEPVRLGTSNVIPPPPPLLPMHNHHATSYSHAGSTVPPGPISPKPVHGSSTEISRSKSMHASLQDLIIDEFSHPKLSYSTNSCVPASSSHDTNGVTLSQAPLHSLPPRKRAWSVTDPGHSWTKYSRLQSSVSLNASVTGSFPSSPPALSPVSAISPDYGDVTTVGQSDISAAGSHEVQESPPRILSSLSNSCSIPPPLLCATEYSPASSLSTTPYSLPCLPLVATTALHR